MPKQNYFYSSAIVLLFSLALATPSKAQNIKSSSDEVITVTAKRITEKLQDSAVTVSVVSGNQLETTGTFNTNRLQQIQPALQFYSQNQRNTNVNIRGLGAPFGLTNDGIEQGVGFYIDDVYYSRIAAATFDFLDIQQIEVLRGPQGTLYGKNTTAGAINITSRKPSFEPIFRVGASYGNYGYSQVRGAASGRLTENIAGRLSASFSKRNGTSYNVARNEAINEIHNFGVRGQFLYNQNDDIEHLLSIDFNQQRPNGSGLVYYKVAPTERAQNRQYDALASHFNYAVPSVNPFDRIVDHDSKTQGYQEFGGVSLKSKFNIFGGDLTNIVSWRYWDWDPQNDRDWIGIPITTISANPSKQQQYSEELRFNKNLNDNIDILAGIFLFNQNIKSKGLQEQGSAASYWLLGPASNSVLTALGTNSYASLLDGLKQTTNIKYENNSAAIFGRIKWKINDKLSIEPGLRYNYDQKKANYNAAVTGGLNTNDANLIRIQKSILQSQSYNVDFEDTNFSGDITFSYKPAKENLIYATYAKSFRSGGVNLSGIPTRLDGTPALETATVKPEEVNHYEIGSKNQFFDNKITLNLSLFRTDIDNYQATVVNGAVGVLRGYLANAKKVRTQGYEVEFKYKPIKNLKINGNYAYNDAKYLSFPDAPVALEKSGGRKLFEDISGTVLPGVSKNSANIGFEYSIPSSRNNNFDYYIGADTNFRSKWSSSATVSNYLWVDGYSTTNIRTGLRNNDGLDISAWVKNLNDTKYFEQLVAQSGSTGLILAQTGEPRTYGITISKNF